MIQKDGGDPSWDNFQEACFWDSLGIRSKRPEDQITPKRSRSGFLRRIPALRENWCNHDATVDLVI
jgi:hypothetical protein